MTYDFPPTPTGEKYEELKLDLDKLLQDPLLRDLLKHAQGKIRNVMWDIVALLPQTREYRAAFFVALAAQEYTAAVLCMGHPSLPPEAFRQVAESLSLLYENYVVDFVAMNEDKMQMFWKNESSEANS